MDWIQVAISLLVTLSPFLFAFLKTFSNYQKAKKVIGDIASLFNVLDAALKDDNVSEDEWNIIYVQLKKLIEDTRPATP